MERRNFLKMMVGGVAAAAAVRTFPFRVFSFAKEIQYPALFGGDPGDLTGTVGPLSLYVRRWDDIYDPTGPYMGISRGYLVSVDTSEGFFPLGSDPRKFSFPELLNSQRAR
jgi:hypothetical protein